MSSSFIYLGFSLLIFVIAVTFLLCDLSCCYSVMSFTYPLNDVVVRGLCKPIVGILVVSNITARRTAFGMARRRVVTVYP